MKTTFTACILAALGISGLTHATDFGTAFTYQGFLEDGTGPVTNTCDFRFGLWRDAESALPGDQVGTLQTVIAVEVANGVFTVGSPNLDFGSGAIDGSARWLAIEVQCPEDSDFVALSPRVELTPVPHAVALRNLRVEPAGPNANDLSGPNIIGGYSGNSVAVGVVGATVLGGGEFETEPLPNTAEGDFSTVGGGLLNNASGHASVIGGGEDNAPSGDYSTVGGGLWNSPSGDYSTVGGGEDNDPSGDYSTVGGGEENAPSGHYSTVGGGLRNHASGYASTVGGGEENDPSGTHSTTSGGYLNIANGDACTVGGGYLNSCSGPYSTVGGGGSSSAGGSFSTIPGGLSNDADGDYSFAAGRRAKANHPGAFMWADATDADFTSTGPNQFLIRAAGGVGIGTNAPTESLDVVGNIRASGVLKSGSSFSIDGTGANVKVISSAALEMHTPQGANLRVEPASDGIFSGPNIVGGYNGNMVAPGVVGATVFGGGEAPGIPYFNFIDGNFATISGGLDNWAYERGSTVGGGEWNRSTGEYSSVGGGAGNRSLGNSSTVGGGIGNNASGDDSTVGGGISNNALGNSSTVPGGSFNMAGGYISFAAGNRAHVRNAVEAGEDPGSCFPYCGDEGTFAWADSTDADFTSTGPNQFLIRASGGVGIGTNSPSAALDVVGATEFNGSMAVDSTTLNVDSTTDRVGIGTSTPSRTLQVGDNAAPDSEGMIRFASCSTTGLNTRSWDVGVPETDDDVSGAGYSFVIDDVLLSGAEFVVKYGSGNTGIGRIPTTNKLEVEGDASKSTAGSWLANSDARIKTNVRSVTDALSMVARLRPVAFRYTEEYKAKHPSVKDQIYFNYIAQEFREVFPDSVLDDGTGLLQMDSYPTGVYAVAAIQELHAIVREKDCEIENLEMQVNDLRSEIAGMKEAIKAIAAQQKGGGQ